MRIEIPLDKKFVHEMLMPIRWGDMDAYGHVNNTVYFRYMEQARVEWISSLGYKVAPGSESMLMMNGFCNFYQQLSYPGELILKTFIGNIGRTSLDVYTSMALTNAPDVEVAVGGATMVWVDLTSGKSAPWPEHVLSQLR
ncbi:MAG: thioesterase [Polynucleobacter sp. 24-46-87]|jgi:acyl-CoA thioester hydrolase|nr:MAG: thioesterase [Polynucleobacter sp. 35-46-207]OYZ37174.1 MAG: thioesterase [Polynucleobacter sp. 16-46-70]OZA12156.1 MAG: thioesterase [Polynucleobacter sp. 24-46-87]OZA40349.1 MAG: thioesterase [Polynucleobacter sp. 17-46-58]OZB48186.1 MAG: thioesterase [Polynucleobacter sp. 39-45-136]